MKMRSECPNCGSIWGIGSEEWEWQQCDCCGWPDADEDFDDDIDPDDYDDDDDIDDPNDSRNL